MSKKSPASPRSLPFTKISLIAAVLSIVSTFAPLGPAYAKGANDDGMLELKSEMAVRVLMTLGAQGARMGATSKLQVISQTKSTENGVDFIEAALAAPELGTIRLVLRGPTGFAERTDHSLRTLFLATGLFTGKSAVGLLKHEDQTVVVGFEYPVSPEEFKSDPGRIGYFIQKTPIQIAAALQWLSQRPWIDNQNLNAVGVSLGGLFLPVSLHISQTLGTRVRGAVFAFTGAHIAPVIAHNLKDYVSEPALEQTVRLINNLTTLHDPKLHLPFLKGEFLVIRGDSDQVFPEESGLMLEDLLPSPKTLKLVHGIHINTDQPELIAQTQKLIHDWIFNKGAPDLGQTPPSNDR